MSPPSSRPPALKPRPPVRRRLVRNDDTRSVQAGLILTLILWPLMLWIFSQGLARLTTDRVDGVPPRKPAPSFNIELLPEQVQPPEPPRPPKFVETNPDAPENIPDKTDNIGAHNQQVAQEKPTPDGKSDRPATEGKKDFESSQIVDGRLTPPEKAPPPAPPPTPEIARVLEQAAAARKEQNPLPGVEKLEGENPEGFGMNLAKPSDNATAVPEKITGQKDATLIVGDLSPAQPRIDPRRPQPRPSLSKTHSRPAILADNKFGTTNIGPVAYDARWDNYGAYLQRLIDSVQIQWERLILESRIYPPSGTIVTVKFRLEATEGGIAEIVDVTSNGGEQAALICRSAIVSRAPYGKWTDSMVAVLGQSQELTFNFYFFSP